MTDIPKNSTPQNLTRRRFLTTAALASLCVLAGCDCGGRCGANRPGIAVGPVRERDLKMVTTWPRDLPGLGDGAAYVARAITEMSGGSMNVKLYAAGEFVGALDVFDAVSGGTADMYHGAEYYWTGRSDAYSFFTAVPFGMTAYEIMAWTEYGGGQALWDELAGKYNLKALAAGNTGHQMGGWFRKEIKSLEDLRGLKIRMPGMGGEVMRRAGATAVTIPGNEVYQALQSGTIDATEWVGPWNDTSLGFYREADYYYWPGFHEPGAQLAVGLNLDLWNDFSPREKSIVTNACRAANNQMLAQYAHFNGRSLKTLLEKHGTKLKRMPDDVMAELARNTSIVLKEIAAKDDLSNRIFESYKQAFKESDQWSSISDEAYLSVRRQFFKF